MRPGPRRELAALFGVEDFWTAMPVEGFLQHLDAELDLHGVRQPPCQNLLAMPVHDHHQIEKALGQRDAGDVRTSDLTGSFNSHALQETGISLVPLGRNADAGLRVDRHQSHQAHQSPDTFDIHRPTFGE